jgi:hypothetical protein
MGGRKADWTISGSKQVLISARGEGEERRAFLMSVDLCGFVIRGWRDEMLSAIFCNRVDRG